MLADNGPSIRKTHPPWHNNNASTAQELATPVLTSRRKTGPRQINDETNHPTYGNNPPHMLAAVARAEGKQHFKSWQHVVLEGQ
ncbi:unnamed protein product [Taenia asiatica]|uniref:Integrase catalytic domain-containing protein n=1 Tax=Taenia asiatica TaxID=60517 RepID=A0A0R3WEZ0_TAEAS|nr:unnamed protein product [Taenia asiatica]